ncbi:MAG: TatD family hydrolase [Thermofilum sp.]
MIDSHCHLLYPGLREKVDEVLESAREALDAIITCGLPFDREKAPGFPGALESLKLARRYSGFVFVTLGLHPTQVSEMSDEEIEEYLAFVESRRDDIVGIGEIGLDRFWIKDELEHKRAQEVFEKFLNLAEKLGKPVVIHSRKAEEEAIAVLSSYSLKKVLMHSFTGSMTAAREALDRGYLFSVNYRVTNTKTMRKIARNFPMEAILVETDAPFLSPDSGINTPLSVRRVAEEVARLRGTSVEEVDEATTGNAIKFFGLEGKLAAGLKPHGASLP